MSPRGDRLGDKNDDSGATRSGTFRLRAGKTVKISRKTALGGPLAGREGGREKGPPSWPYRRRTEKRGGSRMGSKGGILAGRLRKGKRGSRAAVYGTRGGRGEGQREGHRIKPYRRGTVKERGKGWGKSGGTVGGTSGVTTESCVPGVQDMVRRSVVGGSLVGLRWFWSRVSGSEATWIKSVDGSGWSGGADLVDPIVVVSPRSWRVGDGSGLLSTEWCISYRRSVARTTHCFPSFDRAQCVRTGNGDTRTARRGVFGARCGQRGVPWSCCLGRSEITKIKCVSPLARNPCEQLGSAGSCRIPAVARPSQHDRHIRGQGGMWDSGKADAFTVGEHFPTGREGQAQLRGCLRLSRFSFAESGSRCLILDNGVRYP